MCDTILVCTGLIFFSVFGASVKWLNASKESPSTIRVLVIEAITAVFIGILFYCVYRWDVIEPELVFILSGLSGYYGTAAIDMLGKFMAKRFNVEMPGTKEEKKKKEEQ